MVTFKYWNRQLSPHTKLNIPDKFQYAYGNTVGYLYDAAGSKLSVADTTVNTNLLVPMGKTVPVQAGNVLTTMKTDYCGNIIYEDGVLSKILTEEGYVTLSGSNAVFHYYLKDHEGNNRVVLNQNGTVEQVNNYYPFGGLYGDNTGGPVQPYMYNGKELDRMHGLDLFDYGARHYDAALGRWFTVDLLTEKRPWGSSYSYCSNDPINRIDPTGMDEWYLDSKGNVVKHVFTGTHDAFYMYNEGNQMFECAYGTVEEYGTRTCHSWNKETKKMEFYIYDYYKIKDDEIAKMLFKFLSNKGVTTGVEWTKLSFGEKEGSLGENYLSTTHSKSMEAGGMSLFYDKLQDVNIRSHTHYHPGGQITPGKADLENAARPIELNNPEAKMYIYTVLNGFTPYFYIKQLPPAICTPKSSKE